MKKKKGVWSLELLGFSNEIEVRIGMAEEMGLRSGVENVLEKEAWLDGRKRSTTNPKKLGENRSER